LLIIDQNCLKMVTFAENLLKMFLNGQNCWTMVTFADNLLKVHW
jgi:hypothetical protein